jgi:hypothetical protein
MKLNEKITCHLENHNIISLHQTSKMNKKGERSIQCNKTKTKVQVSTNKRHILEAQYTQKNKIQQLFNSKVLTIKHLRS